MNEQTKERLLDLIHDVRHEDVQDDLEGFYYRIQRLGGRILGAYHREGDFVEARVIHQLCDQYNATIPEDKLSECEEFIFDYFEGLEFGWVYNTYNEFVEEAFEQYLIERDVN